MIKSKVEQFYDMLSTHDWTYHYASGNAFANGQIEWDRIVAYMHNDPRLKQMYNDYLTHISRMPDSIPFEWRNYEV